MKSELFHKLPKSVQEQLKQLADPKKRGLFSFEKNGIFNNIAKGSSDADFTEISVVRLFDILAEAYTLGKSNK